MTDPFLESLIFGIRDILNGSLVPFVRKSRIQLGNNLTGTVDEANQCIRIDATSSSGAAGSNGDVQVNLSGSLAGVSPGADGNVLTAAGGAWTSAAPSGGSGSAGADNDVQIGDGAGGFRVDTANFQYDPVAHTLIGGTGCSIGGGATNAMAFGLNCQANANNAIAFGDGTITSFANSICAGIGCGDGGQNSVCMGNGCSTIGANGVAMGVGSQATTDAVAIGDDCHALGTASTAFGLTSHATRWAEFTHAGGVATTSFDGTHGIDVAVIATAAPANLVLGDTTEFAIVDSRAYSVRVRAIAAKAGGGTFAHEVHEILCHGDGAGNLVIDSDDLITSGAASFATAGYTLTISAPSGLTFRIACDPAADTVHFGARIEWSSIGA